MYTRVMDDPRLDRDTFDLLQRLARLELSPEEAQRLRPQLEAILRYTARLSELPSAPPPDAAPACRLREGAAEPGLSQEEALDTAPDADRGLFLVPPILGGQD